MFEYPATEICWSKMEDLVWSAVLRYVVVYRATKPRYAVPRWARCVVLTCASLPPLPAPQRCCCYTLVSCSVIMWYWGCSGVHNVVESYIFPWPCFIRCLNSQKFNKKYDFLCIFFIIFFAWKETNSWCGFQSAAWITLSIFGVTDPWHQQTIWTFTNRITSGFPLAVI